MVEVRVNAHGGGVIDRQLLKHFAKHFVKHLLKHFANL